MIFPFRNLKPWHFANGRQFDRQDFAKLLQLLSRNRKIGLVLIWPVLAIIVLCIIDIVNLTTRGTSILPNFVGNIIIILLLAVSLTNLFAVHLPLQKV